jgi:hypothetical protein
VPSGRQKSLHHWACPVRYRAKMATNRNFAFCILHLAFRATARQIPILSISFISQGLPNGKEKILDRMT